MIRKIIRKRRERSILLSNPYLLYKEEQVYIKQSFYFEGKNNKAVLLLHGWSTTSYELRRLGKYLNRNGYTVYAPMFSGHGTKYQDLEKIKYTDWLNDADKAYSKLRKTHTKVFVGGTSMGANVSLCLAKEKKDISGLILMATPHRLKFERIGEITIKIVNKFKKYHKKFYPPTFGSFTTITRLISYQKYPIENALELGKLVKLSRENLDKVVQPCLLLQSEHDHIITKNSAIKIYEQISSKKKRIKYLKKAYHTFISDIKNEHIFGDVLDFLEKN
ncbi:MAG TPA: alpha/beta fold hydrolase [Candidatus Moranbacteria bacterium]|nr:alpha/beta fold hydrolase [Candidatus Moranbacteria bacterium]